MLPYRQIHLDFHTSECIPDIGKDFDGKAFAATMKAAHVNSVTCFARGHHGWLYYDSPKFPERIHPNLKAKNMLKDQVDALHDAGIRAPIYISVQWDKYTARKHPEWLSVDGNGDRVGAKLFDASFEEMLCVNSPYRDFLREQTQEVLDIFDPVDGIFFDITYYHDCCCKHCLSDMEKQGIPLDDEEARMDYARQMLDDFKREFKALVQASCPEASVYFNTSHITTRERHSLDTCSHLEVESLPSGNYGYLHFPITMRYARQLGKECVGMNGKFHTEWADFHSFKNPAALEFECFNILALGGKIIVGDQLHPNGQPCPVTYKLIGDVFRQVEQVEPFIEDSKPVVEIGVYHPDEFVGSNRNYLPDSIKGVTRMLQELSLQFNIIDSESALEDYKLLILPDEIQVNEGLAKKLKAYAADGGKLILSHKSGLDSNGKTFIEDLMGVRYMCDAPFEPDYIYPEGVMAKGLASTEYVMYDRGMSVDAKEAEVLSMNRIPYFNRTWEHFCSHRQTPSSGKAVSPAVTKHGNVLYFAHPIFGQYERKGTLWVKQLLANALDVLMPERLLRHDGPSTLLTSITHQGAENRDVAHLLHYIPERRCQKLDIIEDVIPLYNLGLDLGLKGEVKQVTDETGKAYEYTIEGDRLKVNVDCLKGHRLVVVQYV